MSTPGTTPPPGPDAGPGLTSATEPARSDTPPKSPAAERVLDVLGYVSRRRSPVGAQTVAAALGLPRSTVYQLLTALVRRGYLVHFPEEKTFGLGLAAFELSMAYARQEPIARASRPILERLVDAVGESGHVAVLRGSDVVYVNEERAKGRPSLVTDVGVRLPAHLTATGRSMLAALPAAQIRAVFPSSSSFERRIPGAGPESLRELRALLSEAAERGCAVEEGEVTEGFASIAAAALDRVGMPVASFAVTFVAHRYDDDARERLATRVQAAARELESRM
ncbi:IclR family transcriptional regulator [Falsarthrobacter nasiphocae]|uniref:DNA-binding IclR family transcriptional regulator n=1 Tax=Falsarthrobacter nasiphocae TaxID=189863 RepID=A0AAE4C530_9MICC|nr:IclR family transcriptional regulator [Falsarthrobacter nasiphocae]MDR6891921.1 DNA-binding IclR family transcriptional regulator [Falsarthrobacter nasiphocae]